jgi:polyisoprenoid-binding protein YceI
VEASEPGAAAVIAGRKSVTSVAVSVPVQQLDCVNGTMNEHMLKALKAKEHGNVTFRVSSYDLTPGGAEARVTLQGTLTIGGHSRPVTISATAQDAGSRGLRVIGSHQVRMTEFGLTPPSLMMGTIKVGDRVVVNFDLYLKG